MLIKNIIKHFCLITHHRWIVFKLCCKIGEPWRGLVHDLSKYSWTEFGESIKYYVGTHSPIIEARKNKGYSEAWMHHKGRNKHHPEYWTDELAPNPTPIIPYRYAAEMLCDKLAAGIIYQGKNWTKEYQLDYWNKEKDKVKTNEKIKCFITECLEIVAKEGIDKTLNRKRIKKIYKKHCA